MKFSIRDLFLVTMIAAILLAWWVDRRRLRAIYSKDVESAINETVETEKWATELRAELDQLKKVQSALPTSQAPAPNPPKP